MTVNRQASVKSIRRRSRKSQKVTLGRAKEFRYRNFTLDELKKMDKDQLMKILPARARRSLKREMGIDQVKLYENLIGPKKQIKTHVRDMVILPRVTF